MRRSREWNNGVDGRWEHRERIWPLGHMMHLGLQVTPSMFIDRTHVSVPDYVSLLFDTEYRATGRIRRGR
jgi:hypothetical protein